MVVVSRAPDRPLELPALIVDDTVAALGQLAGAYRDELGRAGVKVIAVAGSNGKTTTRHLIHVLLSARWRGSQSPKSFNNHIGVPLTLLAAGIDDDFVVVEIGTNHPGEVAALGAVVRPDAAVITSIGHEHMAYFATLEAVAAEEASLLKFVRPDGVAVTPGRWQNLHVGGLDAEHLEQLPPGVVSIRTGDDDDCHITAQMNHADEQQHAAAPAQVFDVTMKLPGDASHAAPNRSLCITWPLVGRHNIANAAAAIAVARWFGADDAAVARALRDVRPLDGRMQLQRIGVGEHSLWLIHDAYNANFDSTINAIDTLATICPPQGKVARRVMIFGDMLELGEQSPDLHAKVGLAILKHCPGRSKPQHTGAGIDLVILIGPLSSEHTGQTLQADLPADRLAVFSEWSDALATGVAAMLRPGDLVLIKASRGMGFERLIPAIEAAMSYDES